MGYPRRTVPPTIRTTSRRLLLAIALSLLVFAQQGVVLHALSHWTLASSSAGLSGGHDGTEAECGLCLAFSALAAGAPAPSLDLALLPAQHRAAGRVPPAPPAAPAAFPYRSRAPPRLA